MVLSHHQPAGVGNELVFLGHPVAFPPLFCGFSQFLPLSSVGMHWQETLARKNLDSNLDLMLIHISQKGLIIPFPHFQNKALDPRTRISIEQLCFLIFFDTFFDQFCFDRSNPELQISAGFGFVFLMLWINSMVVGTQKYSSVLYDG